MSRFYEKYLLPRCLNFLCSAKQIAQQREKIVPMAGGTVLEIGSGSGLNFEFYDTTKIDKIIGLDPSTELTAMAHKVADEQDLEVEFLMAYAEEIDLPKDRARGGPGTGLSPRCRYRECRKIPSQE